MAGRHLTENETKAVTVSRVLPTVVGDYVEIGSLQTGSGSHSVIVLVQVTNGSFAATKSYIISANYNGTGATTDWRQVAAISDPGGFGGNNYKLDIDSTLDTLSFRLVRTGGTTAGNAEVTIIHSPDSTFTASSTTGTGSSSAWYDYAKLSQRDDLYYGDNRVLTDADLTDLNDADTLDGLDSTQFLRSDADDIFSAQFLDLSHTQGTIRFTGYAAAADKGIQFEDSGGASRWGIAYVDDEMHLRNRAADGVIKFYANNATPGAGGEVHVATMADTSFNLQPGINMTIDSGSHIDFGSGVGEKLSLYGNNYGVSVEAFTLAVKTDRFIRFTDDLDGYIGGSAQEMAPSGIEMEPGVGWMFMRGTNPHFKIKGTGDATITIEADSDNVTETDHPKLSLLQDGALVGFEMTFADGSNQPIFNTTGTANASIELYDDGVLVGRILTTADEGSGNGIDADTVDGIEGANFLRSDVGDTASGHITFSAGITIGGGQWIQHNATSSYDKVRVWNDSKYSIGMVSAQSHGWLNDYSMTFTMNNDIDRGFLWRDDADTSAQGAMSLTTDGRLWVNQKVHAGTRMSHHQSSGAAMYRILGAASYSSDASNQTGALVINLGRTWASDMMHLFLTGYDYRGEGDIDMHIYGYDYGATPVWTNRGWRSVGSRPPGLGVSNSVRFGHETATNYPVIVIGDTTSDWDYPKFVLDILVGFGVTLSNYDNVNITIQSSLAAYTLSSSDVADFEIDNNDAYIDGNKFWHAGNDGAGSGLDADLLDGISSGSFLRSDAADTLNYGAGIFTITNTQVLIDNGDGTDTWFNYQNLGSNYITHTSGSFTRFRYGATNVLDVNNNGITMATGKAITLAADPTAALHAATKQYVDANSGGVTDHGALTGLGDDDHPQYVLNTGDTINGLLTVSRDSNTGTTNTLQLAGNYVNLRFDDTGQAAADGRYWWLHVNSGYFYLLRDNTGNALWNTPHPMRFDSSVNDVTFWDGTTGTLNVGTLQENGTNLSAKYLGISAKAADSNLLDGIDSSAFLRSNAADTWTGKLTWGGTGTGMSFGSLTDQLIDLYSTTYAIGIQSGTLYFRTGGGYAFHKGGVHSDTLNDPGTGGTSVLYFDDLNLSYVGRIRGGAGGPGIPTFSDVTYPTTGFWISNDTNIGMDLGSNTVFDISSGGSSTIFAFESNGSTDTTLEVLVSNDAYIATVEAHGISQGTGRVYVGQSNEYGGGIIYQGDATPAVISGSSADDVVFFRRDNSTDTAVFYYNYNTSEVYFNDSIMSAGGTAANPAISFTGDADTGIYNYAANQIGFSAAGALVCRVYTGGMLFIDGIETAPAMSFSSDSNVGWWRYAADQMAVSTGGGLRGRFYNGGLLIMAGSAATPSYSFHTDTTTGLFEAPTDGEMGFSSNGNERFRMTNGGVQPGSDNLQDCGTAARRWDDIWATNTLIQSSDMRIKSDIIDSDRGLGFINKLRPVKFKHKDKKRPHYGLVAQDVESVIKEENEDFAGFIDPSYSSQEDSECPYHDWETYEEKDVEALGIVTREKGRTSCEEWHRRQEEMRSAPKGLRMGEFIAPMIKAIQELSAAVESLSDRVAALEV